jgi:hypothetical protein
MPPTKPAPGKKGEPAPAPAPPPLDPEQEAERRLLIEQCKLLKAQRIQEEGQFAEFHEQKVMDSRGIPLTPAWSNCHCDVGFLRCVLQDRLNQLWIVAKRDMDDKKLALRSRRREREEMAEAQAVEIKVGVPVCDE